VDPSVTLRALRGHSSAAREWFESARAVPGTRFVTSRLGEVEVRRVLRRFGIDPQDGQGLTGLFWYTAVTDEICGAAMELEPVLSGADSIHVATALRLRPAGGVLVTHDREMAAAALVLKLPVIDPVTDDPGSSPVAPASVSVGSSGGRDPGDIERADQT
jgi:predicted nucleic acid-binding protein